MFYCNFMFATSSVSSTSNVPTANDIAAGLQGMQQLQNDNDINNDSNSSEELDHQIDLETAAVMKERVAESTRGGYDSRNVTFMVWLFDSGERYQHLLEPRVLADMKVAHQKDQGRKTKKGNPSKKRDYLRASCTRALAAIDPTIKETIPVKLEALEFKVFTRFLSTFKKRVTKRTKDVMEGEVVMNVDDTGGGFDINNEDVEDIVLSLASDGAIDQLTRERTRKQLKERKITIGWHHGRMNPLPADWQYPNGVTLIQLINLWLIGIQRDNVPPLQKVSPHWVYHFDSQGRKYSQMKQVMKFVEKFGRARGVWASEWDGEKITTLWSAIWEDFDPYMRTETKIANDDTNSKSYHKSRKGQVAYSTIYNKLWKEGKLKGNKARKRQKTGVDKVDMAVEERRMKVLAAKVEEEREANDY